MELGVWGTTMGDILLLVMGVAAVVYLLFCAVIIYAFQATVETAEAKVITIVISIAIALGGPVLYYWVGLKKSESEKVAIQESTNAVISTCANAPVIPVSGHSASSYFVDKKLLDMLLHRSGSSPGFDQLAEFLLTSGLDSLEFGPHSNTYSPSELGNGLLGRSDGFKGKYVRLSIADMGNEVCSPFKSLVERFPSVYWPSLRKKGLPLGKCIGIELLGKPEARYQIWTSGASVKPSNSYAHSWDRYRIQLVDTSSAQWTLISEVTEDFAYAGGGKAGSSYYFPCGENRKDRIKAFSQNIRPISEPRKAPKITIEQITPKVFVEISDKDIRKFEWLPKTGENVAYQRVTADGKAWIDSVYVAKGVGQPGATISLQGYAISVVEDGKITQVPVAVDAHGYYQDVRGLGVNGAQFATVITNNYQNSLFIFDSTKRTTSIHRLSPEQNCMILDCSPTKPRN